MRHFSIIVFRGCCWFVILILALFSGKAFSQCNNWLHLPSFESYVSVGDLDIPGNKVTVEATFMRTAPYTGGQIWAGDLVSKHVHPTDANYLLRPNNAEITTTNGYFRTPEICEIELNKVYHAAMVYDGTTLKFYRNGYLMSSVTATGNLFQNNFETRIGLYDEIAHNTNLIGYINEVRIWNVARTQAQIRAHMNGPLPTPTTQAGLKAYYTFDNLLNKQGDATWNGTLGGSAAINKTVPNCNFVADSCGTKPACNVPAADFNYKQSLCNPLTMQFNATGFTPISTFWDFGDGSTMSSTASPSHDFTQPGNYIVRYIYGNGSCTDTITKRITVEVKPDDVILNTDTVICYGSSMKLRTTSSLNFCWFPTTFIDNPNSPNPNISPTHDITYYFNSEVTGPNLIANGDFSQGRTGFTSGYNYASSNVTEGQYFVGTNPKNWNTSLSACGDHTTGNGMMMMINGSPVANVNVWRQTIAVTPNTNYAFSTWIQALWPPNPAELQFSINGQTTGTMITASLPTCTWTQFYTTWNSGENTTADISIVNKNTKIQGNDFALDDISFAEVFVKRDSVKIIVDNPVVSASRDTTICPGGNAQLSANGVTTYTWSPASRLSDPSIFNPIASPNFETEYIVTGKSQYGCTDRDTVRVALHPRPVIKISDDTSICKNTSITLLVTGGISYSWTPLTSLSNTSIANPVASPTVDTKFFVNVTDGFSCTYQDSVVVAVKPEPVFAISPSTAICPLDSVQIQASGGDVYLWQQASGLSELNISDPVVKPTHTTEYAVKITELVCNNSVILTTKVTVLAEPDISITKSNDIDCRHSEVQLIANGAFQYSWAPESSLSQLLSPNPIATPASTTRYYVTGTTLEGCSSVDSIDIIVFEKPQISIATDTTICRNGNAFLSVSGGVKYSWLPDISLNDPNSSNPIATPTTDTRYFVTIQDDIGCEYHDSVLVSIMPEPEFKVKPFISVCEGESIQLNASGGDAYSWWPVDGLSNATINNPVARVSNSIEYSVTITEHVCNNSSVLKTYLEVLSLPVVDATKSNDIDCSNNSSKLTATGAERYEWSPSDLLNSHNIPSPIASPTQTTEFIVKGIDANGCFAYDTVLVKIENVNKSGYFMPTAFTPNGDGLNDCYRVKYWGMVDNFEFSIYNRWGNRIFYTKNPNQCWDGSFKGVPQDAGVYVYIIKASTFCQPEVFRKGTFLIIR